MKRYFFFDIDGTLTDNSTKKIVTSAKWRLDELQRKWSLLWQLRLDVLIIKQGVLWKA
mgnify:CR=1 FL=1